MLVLFRGDGDTSTLHRVKGWCKVQKGWEGCEGWEGWYKGAKGKKVVGTHECFLPLCNCMWFGGFTGRWWKHINPTCCFQIFLNFLQLKVAGNHKTRLYCLLTPYTFHTPLHSSHLSAPFVIAFAPFSPSVPLYQPLHSFYSLHLYILKVHDIMFPLGDG